MSYLADLHHTVAATLASQRLGRPVFVRYHWFGPESLETLATRLAQITAVVRTWLDQDVDRLHAHAAAERMHVGLSLQFRAGGTALIGVTPTPPAQAGVDLMILGNHGALYHEEARLLLDDEAMGGACQDADPLLQAEIERALHLSQSTKT
jgi:hypothetical protein